MSSDVAEMTRVVSGVPDEWREVTLGDIITLEYGRSLPEKVRRAGDVAVYGSNGVVGAHDEALVPTGGIIVGRKGTAGSVTVSLGPFWPIDTTYFVKARQTVDWDWLAATLHHCRLNELNEATGVPGLNRDKAYRQQVLLPPLDEQRRIAEVLRSVDEAIAANSATLAATQKMVEKLARDVADGGSDTATIGELGRVVTGGTPSPKQADLWGGDLPFVTPGDLNEDEVSVRDAARTLNVDAPHGARVLPAGSVLVTCIGSTVGKTAIARSSCATNQQINAICCDPALSGYVYLACVAAYDEIMANAGKQAVPIINKSTFSAITVPTRSRAEMVAVSEMVDALDNEGKAARSALTALNGIKSALMADLLSGHVRVAA